MKTHDKCYSTGWSQGLYHLNINKYDNVLLAKSLYCQKNFYCKEKFFYCHHSITLTKAFDSDIFRCGATNTCFKWPFYTQWDIWLDTVQGYDRTEPGGFEFEPSRTGLIWRVWIGTLLQECATWRRKLVLRAKLNTRVFNFARRTSVLHQVARYWSDVPITARSYPWSSYKRKKQKTMT